MCVSEKTAWILAAGKTHLGPLLFEQHLALDHLVVRPCAPCSAVFEVSDYGRRRVAVVKDEEELVGHFLFDLDHFVVAHKVELGRLATPRSGCAGGKVRVVEKDMERTSSSSCRDSIPRGSARESLNCSAASSSFVR